MSHRLGLIAGGGDLPFEIARAAHDRAVLALGFPGITDPRLADVVDEIVWRSPGEIDAQLRALREGGTGEVVLAGKVEKGDLVRSPERLALDERALRLLSRLGDQRDGRILGAVADMLEDEGFSVLPQAALVPHLLAPPGPIGAVAPTDAARSDLARGWSIAGRLASLGIGQSVARKAGTVVAVEGVEGTDAMIERAVALAGDGLVVVKRTSGSHDPRFDLPAVGPRTVDAMAGVAGGVLAVEAGATLLIDRAQMVERADRVGLALLAVPVEAPPIEPGGREVTS